MAKTKKLLSFDEALAALGKRKFDVSAGANGAKRVSKYGCAAEMAPGPPEAPVRLTVKGGWLLGGEIGRIVDRGYQKFVKTSKLEIPATADILRAIHAFDEEFKEAAGALTLYNEALGTTSDRYVYDRVVGRE